MITVIDTIANVLKVVFIFNHSKDTWKCSEHFGLILGHQVVTKNRSLLTSDRSLYLLHRIIFLSHYVTDTTFSLKVPSLSLISFFLKNILVPV